jgi:CHAT domain-containing protein/Tfp pilus assembly protein PilF
MYAKSTIDSAQDETQRWFPDETDLQASIYQVKGSFQAGIGANDSAKSLFFSSIYIRIRKSGEGDTALHYAYNKLGNLYFLLSDYDSAYYFHKLALDLALKKQNKVNYLSASSYQNLGIAAHRKGDYNQAEFYYTKSLQLKEELFEINDPALAKIYWNLGKFLTDLSKYDLALQYYDKSEQLLIARYDREDEQFAHIYWNKGNVYTHKGDYAKATSYLLRAYSILEENLSPGDPVLSKVLTDLGFAYEKKEDREKAIEYYHKAAGNKGDAGIVKIYRNLGNIYQNLSKSDSAEKYYQLSINYAGKFYAGISYDLALCYQYYGEFLSIKNPNPKSLEYYSKAGEIFKQLFGRNSKDLAQVYFLESKYYLGIKDYDSALNKIQAALITLLPTFSNSDFKINPSLEDFVADLYLPNLLTLKAKALNEKYDKSRDTNDLKLSLKTVHLTLEFIEEVRKSYTEEESQMILNKEARTVIDLGVLVTYDLYLGTDNEKYLVDAFQFSEKGQAIILLSALRGLQAQSAIDIPEAAQNYEDNLSGELAIYNNLLYQENQKKNPDPDKVRFWNDRIFNLKLAQDSILSSYKVLYPDFFRLKYDYSIISPDSIIKWLPEDQVILEYHLTDSVIYCFLITNKQLEGKNCGNSIVLSQKLDSLFKHFNTKDFFNSDQEQLDSIISRSTSLYDMLIRPFKNDITGKRLIIIPDGKLGLLSFDLLLDNEVIGPGDSYNDLPWLIKSNSISYSSSSTIYFEQMKYNPGKTSSNLLAFAPSYDFLSYKRDAGTIDSIMMNLSPITGTKEEIYSIAGLFKTKKRFDEEATEDYFKNHAGDYGILHLAMHTIIDDRNPLYSKLVFSPSTGKSKEDGFLNTYELFSLKLPGYMAVLSACNTGKGKLERGEGIISLARGFFYAGIPSVLMTLWEIEDHSSANLMELFYENLKKGLPNDVALQQAKIRYIENAGKLQSHPYFWAGYVSMGKTSPIILKPSIQPFYYIISGCIFLILIAFIYFFINNRVFFRKKRY